MPEGYCEPKDVRKVLQETDLSGPINSTLVKPAITAASRWLRRRARVHFYDSGGSASDLVPTSARTATTVQLDVPSSPHRQDHQLHHGDDSDWRYPVTHAGPYAKIRLPHRHVQSITTLGVRDRGGDREDWMSAPDKVQGVGEDYYHEADGESEIGVTYLYIRAASIGSRVDFGDLLTLDYEYGLDAQTDDWQDVRRGIAQLAAAEVVEDDGVISQIPDNARLVSVDTEYQHYLDAADKYLGPYLTAGVA